MIEDQTKMRDALKIATRLAPALIILAQLTIAGIGTYYVPIHWDEGWNLCAARVWREHNHYGCLLMGELTTPRLSTGVLPTFFSKLGFELFGVNYFAARIPFLIHLFGFLVVFFILVRKLFSYSVATLALALLFIYPDFRVSPALLTTQANAEVLLYLYLAVGYLLLLNLIHSRTTAAAITCCLAAGLCFGVAAQTKLQARPFVLLSIVSFATTLVLEKRYKTFLLSLITLIIVFFSNNFSLSSLAPQQANIYTDGTGTTGLAQVLGINLDWATRLKVLQYLFSWYWYHLLALVALTYCLIQRRVPFNLDVKRPVMIALFVFATSWTGWFVFLSIDFPRYFSPAAVFGSMFSAYIIVASKDVLLKQRSILSFLTQPNTFAPKCLLVCLATIFFIYAAEGIRYSISFLGENPQYNSEISYLAERINAQSKINSVVETYESQIFHLLNIPYHYPPDQMHVYQISKGRENPIIEVQYNELSVKPAFVFVGEWSRTAFGLYQTVNSNPHYSRRYTSENFSIYVPTSSNDS